MFDDDVQIKKNSCIGGGRLVGGFVGCIFALVDSFVGRVLHLTLGIVDGFFASGFCVVDSFLGSPFGSVGNFLGFIDSSFTGFGSLVDGTVSGVDGFVGSIVGNSSINITNRFIYIALVVYSTFSGVWHKLYQRLQRYKYFPNNNP